MDGKSTNVSRTETGSQNIGLLTVQPADAAAGLGKIY